MIEKYLFKMCTIIKNKILYIKLFYKIFDNNFFKKFYEKKIRNNFLKEKLILLIQTFNLKVLKSGKAPPIIWTFDVVFLFNVSSFGFMLSFLI